MRVRALAALMTLGVVAPSQSVFAQDASEVEDLLYKMADTLGMLRTPNEVDRIVTMNFTGTGSMLINDRACTMESYRASVRYPIPDAYHAFPVPGMRVDVSCATASGESERHVQVVAGELAWNETEPGVNATPVAEAVRERLLQVWLLPHGLVKAAVLAGAQATVTVEAGNPVLTFPLPAPLDDTIVEVTVDPEIFYFHTMPNGSRREFGHRISRVETQFDGDAVEVSYSDYQDWNESDYKSDVLLPGRIVQTRAGETVLDLTLTQSNTYNPYVVFPVPENVPWDGR